MNRDLVEEIIRALVDYPEKAFVKEIRGERIVVYEVNVAQPDIGKVIGREGRIASALRLILSAMTRKNGFKSYINFNDQKRPPRHPRSSSYRDSTEMQDKPKQE